MESSREGLTMRNLKSTIFCVIVFSLSSASVLANNTRFLPGDAFFFTRLSKQEIIALQKTDSPTFEYGNHWNGCYGYGIIGYSTLRIKNFSVETRAALRDAFKRLETDLEKGSFDDPEKKLMSLFVYSKDYPWIKHGIALQYNEDWVEESTAFYPNFTNDSSFIYNSLRLESFMGSKRLLRNWRNSKIIKPLGATCPKLPKGHSGIWSKTPVEIDAAKCKFLIIPKRNFEDYLPNSLVADQRIIEILDGKLVEY
jgi:hypothetical protein